MLDIKLSGGRIADGTGAPIRRADVGIAGDAITAVGDLERQPAGRTIDAAGLVVAPGFIDVHSHSDWRLWANRGAESKIRQGVTTEVVGNCGFSPAPVSDEFRAEMKGFALYLPPGRPTRRSPPHDTRRSTPAFGDTSANSECCDPPEFPGARSR